MSGDDVETGHFLDFCFKPISNLNTYLNHSQLMPILKHSELMPKLNLKHVYILSLEQLLNLTFEKHG
jgi:hypothetical protein